MDTSIHESLAALQKVRFFAGEPAQFWAAFLDALRGMGQVTFALIAARHFLTSGSLSALGDGIPFPDRKDSRFCKVFSNWAFCRN